MADKMDGVEAVDLCCDCGEAVDIVPTPGDRFRRHTICHKRKCGHFMSVDSPITRGTKVSVMKLEEENGKLRSTVLSLTATLRNKKDNDSHRMKELQSGMLNEMDVFFLVLTMMIVMHVLIMRIVLG